jgi:competence protein ComFB
MEIHNIVEDLVDSVVKDIFQTEAKDGRLGFCTCPQCRLDVACYVLNKLSPEYIVSGRGVVYASKDYQGKIQKQADAITLANEAWRRIDQSRRPHFEHRAAKRHLDFPQPPVFNFPTIIGRLFNGLTFAPMDGVEVSLFRDGAEARMMDANWQNPCLLFSRTGGTYIFWPYPEGADSAGESRVFEFELRARAEGFTELEHFFSLRVSCEDSIQDQFSLQRQFILPDLTVFPV